MLTKVRTHPAPDPLPSTWLRAIANSITTEFRATGWLRSEHSRVHHPTGNPRTNEKPTGGVHRSALLGNTEIIKVTYYIAGTVEPIPALDIPPIAWELDQLKAGGALHDRPDLTAALNNLCKRGRRDQPFITRRNRHGNPALRTGLYTTLEERTAIQLVAAACELHVMDETDYWDALAENDQLDGPAVLRLLEAA